MAAKPAKSYEEVKEITIQPAPPSTVSGAAAAAAEIYATGEVEHHARFIAEAWAAKIKKQTNLYVQKATALAQGEKLEEAEPWTPTAPPYPWWNLLLAGPFQPTAPAPGGPYLAQKIFRANEPAFMLGAVWMNPAPINWTPPGPSAATMMGPLNLTIRLETINLSTVTNGPDPAPVVMAPIAVAPGLPFLKMFIVPIGGGFFAAPPQGQPHLYEMNCTGDISGPVAGLPFAGFSTWVLDPDLEPPIFPPLLMPGVPPTWQHDIPARFLVYTA
jgi:hypothetical protein